MNFTVQDFLIALPEIFLLTMACVILLVDVFLSERRRIFTYYAIQATLVGAFVVALPQFGEFPVKTEIFNGHYIVDQLAVISKLFIYFFSLFAFAYAKDYLRDRKIARSEYYILGLFSVLGMSIMVSAYSFLTIFLGLELLSLALYAMVAMHKESAAANEAAIKYFILGSLATGLFLYGVSLVYGLTGTIYLSTISNTIQNADSTIAIFAIIFVLSGLIFKFGAVPFHMWVPDVYQGAATPTTLFISSAPKIAAFVITLRILAQALPEMHIAWEQILIAISFLSMMMGNILAIAQTNLKRMFAYSSISHIGYTLLGIIAGPNSTLGYSAAMFYITTYVLVAAGAFAVITLLSRNGVEFENFEDYRGLNARNPWLAFMMLLLLFSMAGVPPTVGFIAKLGLLEALMQAHLVGLAVCTMIFALIGAYYYLRVVMVMYFEEPSESMRASPIILSPTMLVAISLNGAAALILGVLPSFFIDLCRISVG